MAPSEEAGPAATGEQELLQTLLSWDYLDLCRRLEAGEGMLPELDPMPARFDSVQVRRAAERTPAHAPAWGRG